MKKDKEVYTLIAKLNMVTTRWVDYVDTIGNQCAYTDRGVEAILEIAEELKKARTL